jgi:hypothetical protein
VLSELLLQAVKKPIITMATNKYLMSCFFSS